MENKKDRREYYKDYAKKNHKNIICKDCGGRYISCNIKEHINTNKHKKGVEIKMLTQKLNAMEELIKNK